MMFYDYSNPSCANYSCPFGYCNTFVVRSSLTDTCAYDYEGAYYKWYCEESGIALVKLLYSDFQCSHYIGNISYDDCKTSFTCDSQITFNTIGYGKDAPQSSYNPTSHSSPHSNSAAFVGPFFGYFFAVVVIGIVLAFGILRCRQRSNRTQPTILTNTTNQLNTVPNPNTKENVIAIQLQYVTQPQAFQQYEGVPSQYVMPIQNQHFDYNINNYTNANAPPISQPMYAVQYDYNAKNIVQGGLVHPPKSDVQPRGEGGEGITLQ